MAISGIIEFHASSGSPAYPYQIDQFVAGSGEDYNRLGWFGDNGPGSFITIFLHQDTTFIVNESGQAVPGATNPASGELTNLKYVNSTNVNPNGSGSVTLSTLTEQDATLRIHFTEPSGNAVTTSNGVFKCVSLNASSGVDNVDTIPSNVLVYAAEIGQDSSWTKISDDAANNELAVGDRAGSSIVHDFHIGISVSPRITGQKSDFGFYFELEYV